MDDPRTDETLMLAYREGDAMAFEHLYARHRRPLLRFLIHQNGKQGTREQADEMFQEIWMSVIRARSSYEVSARFTTWLYRIAHNRLVDGFRARGRAADFEVDATPSGSEETMADFPAPSQDEPPRLLERSQLASRLVSAIDSLPAPQREAFLLAAEGGLSVDEIGNATGAGFETAKSRLRYAYGRLRHLLGDLR